VATADGASASSATHRRGARAREARREARVATGTAWALLAERVAPVAAICFRSRKARAALRSLRRVGEARCPEDSDGAVRTLREATWGGGATWGRSSRGACVTATARRLVQDKGKLEKAGLERLAWRVPSTWLALVPSEVSCQATSLCYVMCTKGQSGISVFPRTGNPQSSQSGLDARLAIGPRTKNRGPGGPGGPGGPSERKPGEELRLFEGL